MPLLIAAGAEETEEFRGPSRRFADGWYAAGNRAELFLAEAANHFTVLGAFAYPEGDFQKKVREFLGAI